MDRGQRVSTRWSRFDRNEQCWSPALSGCRRIEGMTWSEARTDQGAAIRHQLGLPPMIVLILSHCLLSFGIPLSAGRPGQVLLTNQGGLYFRGPVESIVR